MNVLDLFSGIGGFSLGLERAGLRTVLAKHWPGIPIFRDVRELSGADVGPVDVICGGFPCQDISSSGAKAGITGQRSGLWLEFRRLLLELRPKYAIVENVSDLLVRGLGDVLGDMAESGYDAEWHSIPASFVGLPQARERVWIVAYPSRSGRTGGEERHRTGPHLELRNDDDRLAVGQHRARDARSWVRRADDGLPNRMDRVKSLGNAVVPQIAEILGRAIMNQEAAYAPIR